jgi:TRAP-type C4-dicarboxylate transport system substrate-binding protein
VSTAEAKALVKLATLAPKESPWGKVFQKWKETVEKRTNGELEVQWLWNGTAGPEASMVGKIKSGQITGAAITAVGLSSIHKPIVALQMPGAFKTWEELDKARAALTPGFNEAMKEAGFFVSGWGDVGINHFMSHGFDVKVPEDLRGKAPGYISADLIYPKVFEAIGGVTPKPSDVVEFLPALQQGTINVLIAPSLAAEQLQWTSRIDHMNTGIVGFGVGATVLSQKQLDELTAEQRDIMQKVGAIATTTLGGIIRGKDMESFNRLKGKMAVHDQSDAEKGEWEKAFKKACQRVKLALPGDVLSKIGYC